VNISQYVYAVLIIGVTLHTPLNAADLMDIYRDALEHDAMLLLEPHTWQPRRNCLRVEQDCFLLSRSQEFVIGNL